MADIYELSVVVLDAATQRGIPGLRIQAWDKDTKYHDLLGVETTDLRGSVHFRFDSLYFGDFAPDHHPDVFFRIYRGEQLLKTTEDAPHMNLKPGHHSMVVVIEQPSATPVERKPDRVTASQALTAVEFCRKSDFKGIGNEVVDKGRSAVDVLGDLMLAGLGELSFEPLRGPEVRTRSVVGQDVGTARTHLDTHRVEVVAVEPYDPGRGGQSVKLLTDTPATLKPGDRVRLFEQNGQVKYYTVERQREQPAIDPGQPPGSIAVEPDYQALQSEVSTLQRELAASREESAEKTQQLTALRTDVTALREANEDMQKRIQELAAAIQRPVPAPKQ